MSEQQPPATIEQFYKFCAEKKFMAVRCKRCGTLHLPPKPICRECYSNEMEWVELSGRGKIVTYTVIHVAPTQFVDMAPYAVAIVELEEGVKITGQVRDAKPEELKIGMEVVVDFEEAQGEGWPPWPRYFFKPAK